MSKWRVVINGCLGRMGKNVATRVVEESPSLKLIAGADINASSGFVKNDPPIYDSLEKAVSEQKVDIICDFSSSTAFEEVLKVAENEKLAIVTGTTGLNKDQYQATEQVCKKTGKAAMIISNFAIGAILLEQFAGEVAPYFEYAEIVETHHENKVDAPSGTALNIVQSMLNGRKMVNKNNFKNNPAESEILSGARGADFHGIKIHSRRLPGKVAEHTVTFGSIGQTLTFHHSVINYGAFFYGLNLALESVMFEKGIITSIGKLLELKKPL